MKKIKLFISAPIAGFENEEEYIEYRDKVVNLLEDIKRAIYLEDIYSAISEVNSVDVYDSPVQSAVKDLAALRESTHFILFYPKKVPSSALVELGYALAENKKLLLIVNTRKDLPYMVQGFEHVEYYNTKVLENNIEEVQIGDILYFLKN